MSCNWPRKLSDTDSVFDLLGMNVLYQPNADGSLQAIPGQHAGALFSLPAGSAIARCQSKPSRRGSTSDLVGFERAAFDHLPGGDRFCQRRRINIRLVRRAESSPCPLPISIPNSATSGMQISSSSRDRGYRFRLHQLPIPLPASASVILPDQTLVTLLKSTSAWLSDGTPGHRCPPALKS